MNVPMNRHQRRAAIATGTALPTVLDPPKYMGPTPTIRVLLIDADARAIKQVITRMHPDDIRKVIGDRKVKWAKLGEIDERIHIMLAGDPSEQTVDTDHRWFEQEFEVLDADGNAGPILHGRAIVFGFAPALGKAASTPVNPIWLQERVRWLDRGAFARLKEQQIAPQLEDQSGQVVEAAGSGAEGVPALPSGGSLDGPAIRN